MKREAEWFGEFTGEAEHEPDALFGKPGCLFGVKGCVSSADPFSHITIAIRRCVCLVPHL